MRSVTIVPRAALRPYVQLIWCFETDVTEDFGAPERIAPDGIAELVVQYRGNASIRFADDVFAPLPAAAMVCQGSRYLELLAREGVGFVSVRFRPWGALHFFDVPVDELSDRIVSTEVVWADDRGVLLERVATARGLEERVEILERFLLNRLRLFRKDDVEAPLRTIWARRGDVRIPALCKDLGISERTAQRVFSRSVGMPPKRYARLVRFLTACSLLRREEWRSLGEVAYRCGYYDQAHFVGDFRAFLGMAPGEFVRARGVSFLELD